MLYFNINKNHINDHQYLTRIIQSIQRSLAQQQTLDNKILVIKLQDIINNDVSMIPKLEFHTENS